MNDAKNTRIVGADEEELPAELVDRVLTPAELAELLGISTERVRQLRHKGILQAMPGGRTRYRFVDAVRSYLNFKECQVKRVQDRNAEASKLHEARAQLAEMRIADRLKRVLPVDDVVKIISEITSMVRKEFATLPSRAAQGEFAANRVAELADEVEQTLGRIDHAAVTAIANLRSGNL